MACALEGISGVLGVYAVESPGAYRYLVHLVPEAAPYAMAVCHYALLRSRGRADSSDVTTVMHLPSTAGLRKVELDPAQREAARARACTTFVAELLVYRPVVEAGADDPSLASAERFLIVDPDVSTLDAAEEAFSPRKVVPCPYVDTALALLACFPYDGVVVGYRAAVDERFLARMRVFDGTTSVVVTVSPDDTAAAYSSSSELEGLAATLVSAPASPTVLLRHLPRGSSLALRGGLLSRPRTTSVEADPFPPTDAPARPRVLLVDRAIDALTLRIAVEGSLDVSLAKDASSAFELAGSTRFDVVVVDAEMLTGGRERLFRALWSVSRRLVARTVLVVPKDAEESLAKASGPSPRRTLTRPYDPALFVEVVRALAQHLR